MIAGRLITAKRRCLWGLTWQQSTHFQIWEHGRGALHRLMHPRCDCLSASRSTEVRFHMALGAFERPPMFDLSSSAALSYGRHHYERNILLHICKIRP